MLPAITIAILLLTLPIQVLTVEVSKGPQPELTTQELYFSYADEITSREVYDFYPDLNNLVKAIMVVESNCQPDVVSSAGCIGPMQLSPYWQADRAKRLGVTDLWDPYGNILVGVDFLRDLYFNYANQDMPLALMMYNMDFSSARKVRSSGQLTSYAVKVFQVFKEMEMDEGMEYYAIARRDNVEFLEKFLVADFIGGIETEKEEAPYLMVFKKNDYIWIIREGDALVKNEFGDVTINSPDDNGGT